ncbi:unnamed protein product [Caenorhabditis sp. 36 PRJEB53466]|nr:unnamed protein product [Caenorhabditis sp. 36 PRJEB53466]
MTNYESRRGLIDPTIVWDRLREGLDVAYRREFMSPQNYMSLYTSVYDYCTSVTLQSNNRRDDGGVLNADAMNPMGRNGGADFVGHEMYRRVEKYVTAYVMEVLKKGEELSGEDLLKYYTTEWENFRVSAKVMDGIFAYLNRHWIRRELDEGHENIYMVYTLALVIWKRMLFNTIKDKVIDAVLELIRSERTGIIINKGYISGVVECLVELGIDEAEGDSKKDGEMKKLAVYKRFFESKFLEATREFYQQEAKDFLNSGGNVTDYMVKVEKRLDEEDARCQLYLNSATKHPLASTCETVLIANQLEFFQSQFGELLVSQRDEDLSRMFKLCDRVANGLDQLRVSLERHIAKEGHDAIERVVAEASTDARLYVKTLLEVHERYNELVAHSFKGEPGFTQSLDKAATSFINSNAVTRRAPANSQLTKSAELLARYCDQLLRKSSKMPDERELEDLLNKIMIVFKYIDDKDVFSKFYTKMFSKRLINDLSASDEAEANFISKLKSMCGYEYTARLSKMVNDTQVSKDLTADFKDKKSHSLGDKLIEFNVLVLSSGSWPTFPQSTLTLPAQLSNTIELFGVFYNEKFSGRRLTWVYSQCRGEITSSAFSKKYVFTVTTAQMCTMLLFNEQDTYTVEQISNATGMDAKTTPMIVGSLIKNLVLKADTELQGEEIPMSATVSLNLAYTNKKVRVDLSKLSIKQEQIRDTEHVQKNVEEDRKSVISACIVRIMKTRKRISHQQLMTEVIAQLSGRFKPKVEMIKRCIGSLIEKEYMLRSSSSGALMILRFLSLLPLFSIPALSLFPGAEPDEGDVRHLYPPVYIGIGLSEHAHAIPYLLGWLENLEYPKDRIRLELFVLSKEDATIHQVKWWVDSTKQFFKHVKIMEETDNWLENALRNARLQKAVRCLLMTGDTVPTKANLIQMLFTEKKHVAVSPLFHSIDGSTNIEEPSEALLERKNVREEILSFALPLAIELSVMDSSYLTFDRQNLPFYEGADDPSEVFVTSAQNMGIPLWADNQADYGIFVNPSLDIDERRNTIRYHIADFIADELTPPFVSKSVRPYQPDPTKLGVDKIYLINLNRRTERLDRMHKIFDLLGVEYTVMEATDGQKLEELPAELREYQILEGYLDPITKRPMKKGEIGCFLSHYRIWQDVVKNKLQKVIVFEDDLRFAYDGLTRVREVLQDLEASRKPWDLIYLGRKKQSDQQELWVAQHRHLSTVEYSYWTLGYMLSLSGAQKLLAPGPLKKMVPVDEYLPIMFNKHPNKEWSSQFEPLNVDAFTLYPLVVFPQRYANEQGYVSDTEDSLIVPPKAATDEL